MTFFDNLWIVLTDVKNWSVSDAISFFSMLLVVIGGFFAYQQWRASNKIKRTEFINQIIEKLRFDKAMVDTMYTIEYDYSWYNEKFHGNENGLEYKIDKLLSYLSYICYIFEMNNISKREFKILRYELNRTCSSPAVQRYLWNLYHFSKKQNTECTFQYLIEYGLKNKIIDKAGFENSQRKDFPKYLNF